MSVTHLCCCPESPPRCCSWMRPWPARRPPPLRRRAQTAAGCSRRGSGAASCCLEGGEQCTTASASKLHDRCVPPPPSICKHRSSLQRLFKRLSCSQTTRTLSNSCCLTGNGARLHHQARSARRVLHLRARRAALLAMAHNSEHGHRAGALRGGATASRIASSHRHRGIAPAFIQTGPAVALSQLSEHRHGHHCRIPPAPHPYHLTSSSSSCPWLRAPGARPAEEGVLVGCRTGAHGRRMLLDSALPAAAPATEELAPPRVVCAAAAAAPRGVKVPLARSWARSDCCGSTTWPQLPLDVRTAQGEGHNAAAHPSAVVCISVQEPRPLSTSVLLPPQAQRAALVCPPLTSTAAAGAALVQVVKVCAHPPWDRHRVCPASHALRAPLARVVALQGFEACGPGHRPGQARQAAEGSGLRGLPHACEYAFAACTPAIACVPTMHTGEECLPPAPLHPAMPLRCSTRHLRLRYLYRYCSSSRVSTLLPRSSFCTLMSCAVPQMRSTQTSAHLTREQWRVPFLGPTPAAALPAQPLQ
jgi:hypothetical protein